MLSLRGFEGQVAVDAWESVIRVDRVAVTLCCVEFESMFFRDFNMVAENVADRWAFCENNACSTLEIVSNRRVEWCVVEDTIDGQFELVHSNGRVVWDPNCNCLRQSNLPSPEGGVCDLANSVVNELVIFNVRIEAVSCHPCVYDDIEGCGSDEFLGCTLVFSKACERGDSPGQGDSFCLDVLNVNDSSLLSSDETDVSFEEAGNALLFSIDDRGKYARRGAKKAF